jgi:Rieske Fe-S protein
MSEPSQREPKWREDFPIDIDADHYVARRDFTRFLVITSFAFVVGQLWIGVQSALRKRRGAPAARAIEGAERLAVGEAMAFTYPGPDDPCLLVRISESERVAYGAECTHLACGVRPDVASSQLLCPCHLGYFDLRTGAPVAGPPRRPLPRVRLEERGGKLYAVGLVRRTS